LTHAVPVKARVFVAAVEDNAQLIPAAVNGLPTFSMGSDSENVVFEPGRGIEYNGIAPLAGTAANGNICIYLKAAVAFLKPVNSNKSH
jgi:hypothetical protein